MRIIELEQGTAEWLAWRTGGIGASDAPVVMGVSPFKKPERLLAEMTGKVECEASTYAMRRGTRLEPFARRWFEQETGQNMPSVCGEHDRFDYLRASFDGLGRERKRPQFYDIGDGIPDQDEDGEEIILEIKWPNADAHDQARKGIVPEYYLHQVQHQLFVSGAAKCYYLSGTENKQFGASAACPGFAMVEVYPDIDMQGDLLVAEMLFWKQVLAGRKS